MHHFAVCLYNIAFTHTSGVLTMCSTRIKKTLNHDGTYTEKEILPIHMTIDHRFVDGTVAAKLLKKVFFLKD